MVEKILIAFIVIISSYFIIRIILGKIAGKGSINPCNYCTGCSLSTKNKESCEKEDNKHLSKEIGYNEKY